MIRVKITKPNRKYAVNSVQLLSNNEAFGLIDAGYAIVSKDMTAIDYKTKRKPNGRPS